MTIAPARWFEPAPAAGGYRPRHYLLLAILLVAGALLRFWRLGNVGLHGDEDLMALAARGVIHHGTPLMPGGMTYPRAPVHTYLLAAAIRMFGETEWALRLPSAIAGTACGWLAFVMGRRFLAPAANLAFVATILFTPSLIEDSQTARMYILFIACLFGFGACVFRWERTQRVADLGLSFAVWLLALQFHFLAILVTPLFLLPGLARSARRLLWQGAAALVAAGACYLVIDRITSRFYPAPSQHPAFAGEAGAVHPLFLGGPLLLGAIGAAALAALVVLIASARRRPLLPAAAVLGLSVIACAFTEYHLGAIALLVGGLLWVRSGEPRSRALWLVLAAVAVIAALQFAILHGAAGLPLRKLVAALVGRPGPWPVVRFAEMTPFGVLAYGLVLGFAVVRLARQRAVPEHILVFVLTVWIQILAVGFFRRDVPPRYTIGALPFFLMCLIAGIGFVLDATRWGQRVLKSPALAVVFWLVVVAAIVNPVQMWRIARNDYATAPDHKGAAEFIRGLPPGPGDLLIAEDSIVQTYYLGRVDYRLLDVRQAAEHSVLVNGVLRGQYCGTPVIGTGREFEAVLDQPRAGRVYVIGSGEDFEDQRRAMRGSGIAEVLESGRFEVVYRGRDQRTLVWRLRG